jgi:O-antigen ligase
MSTGAAVSQAEAALPAWRDPQAWARTADITAVLVALSLPWSTSLLAIFVVVWVIAVLPTIELKPFLALLKRPICVFPVALVVLALIGMLWSDAAWGARSYALSPTAKLLTLPILFYHYQRSSRAMWAFTAFLISCSLLMAYSWVVAFYPQMALRSGAEHGVPVKNYIDQSQEFAICAVALAYPIINLLREKKIVTALLLGALALSFVVNMAFVIVSRTALVTIPILLAVFALLHLRWRSIAIIGCAGVILGGLAWVASPQLRTTVGTFERDYRLYKEQNIPTSMGLRIEFWRKSLQFFAEAPLFGHGTGSTRGLFEQAATGDTYSATSQVIGNPHNQTLNVAIQWGALGIVVLYGIWLSHLLLFRGEGLVAWLGLLVVVQNIFTSLFNSHLFDFHEGWMYVLGVGIAGGTLLRAGAPDTAPEQGKPLKS